MDGTRHALYSIPPWTTSSPLTASSTAPRSMSSSTGFLCAKHRIVRFARLCDDIRHICPIFLDRLDNPNAVPMQLYTVQTYRRQLGTRNAIIRIRDPRCIGLAAWDFITRSAPFNAIATGECLLANGKTSHRCRPLRMGFDRKTVFIFAGMFSDCGPGLGKRTYFFYFFPQL